MDVRNWISICSLSTVLRASHNKQIEGALLQLVKCTILLTDDIQFSTKQRCEDVLYQQFHKPLVSRQRISPRRLHLCVIQSRILILDYTKWLHSPEPELGTLTDHINSLDTSYCILDICRTNNNVKTIKCLRCSNHGSNSMNRTKIDQHFN